MLGRSSCESGIKSLSASATTRITPKALVEEWEYAITKSESTNSIAAISSVTIDINLVDVTIVESEKVPVTHTRLGEPALLSVAVMYHLSSSTEKS